jgi:putative Holliday junction resolvase
MPNQPFPGRLLGIDHGTKFIGLAVCDRIGMVASPLEVLRRKSRKEDFATINIIITRETIVAIILGLPPRPPDFVGTSQSDIVRRWGKRLAAVVGVPVYLWDEGLSTVDAEDLLADAGKRRPERVDAYAAAVILQSFLDAHRDGQPWPSPIT